MSAPADTLRQAIAGTSQAAAATHLGISLLHLQGILSKRYAVSARVAVRLEAIYGISAQKLLVDQTLVELERARMEYERAKMDYAAALKASA